MSWWIPIRLVRCRLVRAGKQRFLVHSRVPRLVEGEDVDVVVLVLLDDPRRILVGVERVHEDERDINIILRVQVLFPISGKQDGGGFLLRFA